MPGGFVNREQGPFVLCHDGELIEPQLECSTFPVTEYT